MVTIDYTYSPDRAGADIAWFSRRARKKLIRNMVKPPVTDTVAFEEWVQKAFAISNMGYNELLDAMRKAGLKA